MSLVQIDLRPDTKTLRQFGFIALAGFTLLAFLAWREALVFSIGLGGAREPLALAFVAVGVVAAFFSAVAPAANRPLYVGLTLLALPIGFVLSYVILTLLFYAIIAPIGLILRIAGKDPLQRGFLPDAQTYWADARPARPKDSYFKQF